MALSNLTRFHFGLDKQTTMAEHERRFGGGSALVAAAGGHSSAGAVSSPPASSPPHTPPDGSGDTGRRSSRAPKRKKFDDEVFAAPYPKGPKRHKVQVRTGACLCVRAVNPESLSRRTSWHGRLSRRPRPLKRRRQRLSCMSSMNRTRRITRPRLVSCKHMH